jgi:predicted GIY-YIG superfamily endonuclease
MSKAPGPLAPATALDRLIDALADHAASAYLRDPAAFEADPTSALQPPARDERTCLYRHFDTAGALLYVGVSSDPRARRHWHNAASTWSSAIARTDEEWFHTRKAALAAEREAIVTENPIHNRQGVPRGRR